MSETPVPAPVPIAVAGALGRMGRSVLAVVAADPRVRLVGGFDRDGVEDTSLVPREAALQHARVVIDFSTPTASVALAAKAWADGGPALVIGSTGFTLDGEAMVTRAAERAPVLRSGNFSLGVNLLAGLVRRAAAALDPRDFDIEVLEAHHRHKVDAPSGTALMLGEAAALGRGVALDAVCAPPRAGAPGPRVEGEIGFGVLRGGGLVGEHSVMFAAEDEILTLSHSARDRSLFARGAVAAALWLADRPPGLYDMQDVLGLKG